MIDKGQWWEFVQDTGVTPLALLNGFNNKKIEYKLHPTNTP